ncbi:hypothetical protein Tco_0301155 [Tanacetum coccineum]
MKVNSSRNPYVIPDVKGNDTLAIPCILIGGINMAGNGRLRSLLGGYGYIKNHKKTVKNGQARIRESEEYKKKPKKQSRNQKGQASVKSSQRRSIKVNKAQ